MISLAALADGTQEKRKLPPAPEGSFSIAVIPDTQEYLYDGTCRISKNASGVMNPALENHISWIIENVRDQRIVFVSHVGDIVDKNVREQWEVAQSCMDRLHGKIPYGISVGNHDMARDGDSRLFQEYFGAERFKGCKWYGGCFCGDSQYPGHSGNNANSFQLFSAGGCDFVILHLECNAPDDVLKWADSILREYPNRIALITTHMYLGPLEKPASNHDKLYAPKGVMRWKKTHGIRGNTPQQMWDKCFQKHPNLRLIFCGDQSGSQAMHLEQTGKNGNVVHSLLSDYGVGVLRIYRFTPDKNQLEVITFDTMKRRLVEGTKVVPGRKNHQFTIRMNLQKELLQAQSRPVALKTE